MGSPGNLLPPLQLWEAPPEILGVCSSVTVRLLNGAQSQSVNLERAEPLGNASPSCLFPARGWQQARPLLWRIIHWL